jgi:hypothetical protein
MYIIYTKNCYEKGYKRTLRWAQWFMPIILAIQRSGGSWFEASPGKQFARPYLEKKTHHKKKGLVKWLKV